MLHESFKNCLVDVIFCGDLVSVVTRVDDSMSSQVMQDMVEQEKREL